MTKPCCICGEEVKDLEQGCLDGAGHVEISFGYGSVHDTETWTGLIHDKCFKEVFKPKVMEANSDYFHIRLDSNGQVQIHGKTPDKLVTEHCISPFTGIHRTYDLRGTDEGK